MTHYKIKLIGENKAPRKPWLTLYIGGYGFAGYDYAYKFSDLEDAKDWVRHLKDCGKAVFITWHKGKQWGEVNIDA